LYGAVQPDPEPVGSGSPEARLKAGLDLAKAGKPDAAIKVYDELLEAAKDDDLRARILLNRALAYHAMSDEGQAEQVLKLVIACHQASAASGLPHVRSSPESRRKCCGPATERIAHELETSPLFS
jgi:tetratricopeptide (TPR) repeat protein